MARYKQKKRNILGYAGLVVILSMALSAGIGIAFGNSETGKTPVGPTPSSNTGNNTVDPSPGGNGSSTDPDKEPSPKDQALSRQDFTIDPATGMAKEIKVVDDNYMLLVNRTHPLSKTYKPDDMVTVKYVVSGVGKKGETDQLRKVAAEAFEAMVEAAAEDGINIKMRTGFRSYEYQKDRLYDVEVKNKGQEEADKATARPGHSEHQTGLALDVGGETESYKLSYDFGDTKEGKWVAEHCHEYGFIIRYVDGTKKEPGKLTGYVFEPWHIRYIGVEAAAEMYELGAGKLTYEEYLGILD